MSELKEFIKQYKEKSRRERVKDLSFPSGLKFTITLPSGPEVIRAISKVQSKEIGTAEALGVFLKLIEKQFPEGLTLDDLTWQDFSYLNEVIKDFFGQIL